MNRHEKNNLIEFHLNQILNLQEEDLNMMKMEFRQARHHFNLELEKLRSFFNRFKTIFLLGRKVVNKQLYRKYKELQINNGVHNLQGSLHIVKFSDQQDYGMILFKQQEFKQMENFVSRIEQIQKLILLAMNCSPMFASNTSYPVHGSMDKSDQIMMNQQNTKTHLNMGELNGDIIVTNSHAIQNTKLNIDSPAAMMSNSHIENNNFQQMNQQNLKKITINNFPVIQSNYNFKGSQFLQNLQNSNNIDQYPRSLNRIPPLQNNLNHQSTQNQKDYFPLQVNAFTLTEYNQQSKSPQTNNKNNNVQGNNQQNQQQDYGIYNSNQQISLNNYLIKAHFFIHTIINDIKEYQLSCRELCLPEYKKYRMKWNSKESKYREEFDNDIMMRIQNNKSANQKYLQFQQQIQCIQQQAFQIINNQGHQSYFLDSSFVDSVIGGDIQSYSLHKKRKGIYKSVVNRIEDLFQQRTVVVNLRIVLENFIKVLSGGEKVNIILDQYNYVDPDILSDDEKVQLKEAYGNNIIHESYERINQNSNMRSQLNGFNLQIPYIMSFQPSSPHNQNQEQLNFSIQEEDVETFRDMILSIIQSIYNLYKDHSNSINIQVHRLYSKDGEINPYLKYRKKYLIEIIKAHIQLMQQKQNSKPNLYVNTNLNGNQNYSTFNQNQINKNFQNNLNQKTNHLRRSMLISNIKNQNDGQQISISNIPYVQSSKISPNKAQKIQPLSYELGEKALQFQEEQKLNQLQEQKMSQLQNQYANQLSEDTNENNQSFNQINPTNLNSQFNQNFQNNYNPQTVNTPISATRRNQILNMPEQISQTMSNSNFLNINGQNTEKNHWLQQQQQQQNNMNPLQSLNYFNNNQQYNNYQQSNFLQQSTWKNNQNDKSMSESNAQQSLISNAVQQLQMNNFSPLQNPDVDQNSHLNNKDQPESQTINTQFVEKLMDHEKYRKLRAVRINLEIQQSIINGNYTQELSKNTDCFSQMEEFISYLSPIPLVHDQKEKDMQIIHQYAFYVENFIYKNNLPENYRNESNQTEQNFQNGDRVSLKQNDLKHDKEAYESNQIDFDEDNDKVSIESRQKDQKKSQKKKSQKKIDIISEHNQDEFNQGLDISRKSQHYLQHINLKTASQQKDNKYIKRQSTAKLQPNSRPSLYIEGNQTPNLSAQNSYGNVDQKSQDNIEQNIEQNSDRKFLKHPQIREQQISFNGKLDGTQSPFYIEQTIQDATQIDLFNRDTERKFQSYTNSNNFLAMNDNSNGGFTDRQSPDDPLSIERKISDNIAKKTRKQEITARPHPPKNTYNNNQCSNELETSNVLITSQPNDEIQSTQQENVRRDREQSSEVVINHVRDSDGLMRNNLVYKNSISTIKSNKKFPTINTQMSINAHLVQQEDQLSQSEISQQEYRKGDLDERDDKELTMILERSEQNNSMYINTHYRNQLHRQQSKNFQDYFSNQISVINYKSQNLQSQALSEDILKQYSSKMPYHNQNFVFNSIGAKEFYLESQVDGKSSVHPNIQNSNYQQYSFISALGNNQNSVTNQISQDFQMKFNKDEQGNKEILVSQKMN